MLRGYNEICISVATNLYKNADRWDAAGKRISPARIVFALESSVCNQYRMQCASTLLKNFPTGRNACSGGSSNPLVLLMLRVEQAAFACLPGAATEALGMANRVHYFVSGSG
jgi:hypothetical protein